MSYCVNCGVELETSLGECPLCNTPVMNPNELMNARKDPAYPREKGQVEVVRRTDLGIFVSIVLSATAAACGLLNIFVFNTSRWSLAVIGACAILWVIMIPVVIYREQLIYVSILFDGTAVAAYLYLLTLMSKEDNWFYGLAIYIVILATVVVELVTLCIRKFPKSFLTIGLYCISAIGIFCVGLEILGDFYFQDTISLSWAAVVATASIIIDVALVTLLSKRRLRNEVRRRLHF